jgi:hypothetical protein
MEIFYRNERGGITRAVAYWDHKRLPPVLVVPRVGPVAELELVNPSDWFQAEKDALRAAARERARPYTTAE